MTSVRSVATTRRHGDLAIGTDPELLAARRAAIVPAPWTWLRQVHGAEVVTVTRPGEHAGAAADAAVTVVTGAPLAILTADCCPVLVVADGGVGVAHAGWRGLVAGVIEATVAALAALGAPARSLQLGPCIGPCCYEFGPRDLDLVVQRYGESVRSTTTGGRPALDLGAAVEVASQRLGLAFTAAGVCTATSPEHWSHRARADPGRQALVAWLEP